MEFKILGPLEAREGGRELRCRGHKQRLLLAVLLLHANEVVSSDRLIDALWGEHPPNGALKALQMHVVALRKLLEPDRGTGTAGRVLTTRSPGYLLRVEPGQLDLDRFERAVADARAVSERGGIDEARHRLRAALDLWRGPPLCDLSDEEAVRSEIARLDELRLGTIEARIDADLALGRHAAVIGELEHLVAEHPLRERFRAQLMLALYRAGRQAHALQCYRQARVALVDELGIEPGHELRDLERRILVQDPQLGLPHAEPSPGAAPGGAPAAPAEPVGGDTLVGREPELARAMPLIDRALAGRGALLLIGGEPGIGKSRLAEALATRANAGGARIVVGRCWEAGGAPAYWPWVQALRAYVRGTDDATLRRHIGTAGPELLALLPELGERLGELPSGSAPDSQGARFRLFESVSSLLHAAAGERPLTLVLDDLHAADAPSLLLLRFVAGQLAGSPLLLVACYRDGEGGAELVEALAELSREPAAHRLSLAGLDHQGTARLLAATMGRAPGDRLALRVRAETQGNPLFVAEMGRLLATETTPGDAGGRLPIPRRVTEAIARRVQRLSKPCRDMLVSASILGREFDPEVLEHLSGLAEDDVLAALDEAAAAGLVGEVPGAPGRLRFAHILVRDALYEELPASRRLRLHRQVAETLERLHARNPAPHFAELAHHYLGAGSRTADKAIDYAHRAGDRAASSHGYEEAARHYTNALAVIETTGAADGGRTCELLLALGEALSRAGDARAARAALRRAAALAEQAGDAAQLARAALSYSGRFAWARASTDPALVPLLERALGAIGDGDPATRARLLARLAAALRDEPRRERRVALAGEALALAEQHDDRATLAFARAGHWIAVEGADPHEDGLAVSDELLAFAERAGDHELAFTARDFRLQAFWARANRAGIDVEFDALARLADELRQPAQRWAVAVSRTSVALLEGRFEAAESMIAEALAAGGAAESWNAVVSERLQLFVLRRAQGRLAEIEAVIDRSVHEFPVLLRFHCAVAHLHAELGHDAQARAALDRVLSRDLAREHVDAEWLFALCLLPDACARLGDRAAAERVYALLLPFRDRYARAPVEVSFGCVARALGVLAAVLGRHDDAAEHFGAAIEIECRMRAWPWVTHAQHGLAETLLARDAPGDADRAQALLHEAVEGYRALDMDAWAVRAAAGPRVAPA
jgi:DNA-binding SARP family transcriptional activator